MAHAKLSLPDDLLSSNTKAWTGGTGEDSKDQATSDNSIPLSPQWLYAKPVDAKFSTSGGSGEMRSTNSHSVRSPNSHGKVYNNTLKESWQLDGSQDKKDWRKTTVDVENSHCWREEERDTCLLGRRDRRKEECRADSTLTRDITDSRSVSSSDRWHDSGNRNSGYDSRRDSKWSSRWGPVDKDKDSRTDRRVDMGKQDTQIDKQPSATGSRTTSEHENETQDKWRPRRRMEVHAGGTFTHRSAPGFGLERGRAEGSNVRFSAGRGRSSNKGSIEIGRQPAAPAIGSVPLDKNLSYCYPRRKLLDIYRMLKYLSSFDTMHDRMDNVIEVTQEVAIEPLAFVTPDAEEKAIIGDMWLGKITGNGGLHSPHGSSGGESSDGLHEVKNERIMKSSVEVDEFVESLGKVAIHGSFHGSGVEMPHVSMAEIIYSKVDAPEEGEVKLKTPIIGSLSDCLMTGTLKKEHSGIFQEIGPTNNYVELKSFEEQQAADLAHMEHRKLECIKSVPSLEIGDQLPDDQGSLIGFSSAQQFESSKQCALKNSNDAHPLERIIPPEELYFCYLDPQGAIQGPYLGIDILMWFEQGYFGTDLPVRLSDAPDGSPFHELGEVMPYLKVEPGSVSSSSRLSVTVGGSLEESIPPDFAIDCNGATAFREDQHWTASRFEAISRVDGQSRASNNSFQPGIHYSDDQKFQHFASQDKVLLPVRPGSNSDDPLIISSAEIQNLVSDPSGCPSYSNEFSERSISTHEDENVHPFGLLMSELRGNSQLRHAHPSNISSTIGVQGQSMEPFLESNVTCPNQSSFGTVVDQWPYMDTWSDHYSKNTLTNSNINMDLTDVHQSSHREKELSGFDLQHLILQNLQKEQLQQQNNSSHPLSRAARLGTEEHPSHLLELQLQEQQLLQLQQEQQQLERQQQQWQLELQQQRHLEFQQQQQLELQQRRWLELQQQQLKMELQQQQQKLEIQKHHQLLHQQLRHRQVKLLQQQQQRQQHLAVEQLLQRHISDLGHRQPKADAVMDNLLEQLQFRMQLSELKQNPHASGHLDPALEQIIQAKFGLDAFRIPQTDFLDLLQAKHENVLTSDRFHIQQEPLEVQQLPWSLKQQLGMDGERHLSGLWSADEAGKLPRNYDIRHHPLSLGFNTLDVYQQRQRLSSMEEYLNHLRQQCALEDRHQQGLYEPNSVEYERSRSLHDIAPGMMDGVSGCAQHLDSAELHPYLQSADQLGSFSSSIHSLGRQVSDDFYGSQPGKMEYLSRKNARFENSRIEGGMQQLCLETHQQSNVSEVAANSSIWASTGGEGENSKRLDQKLLLQSIETLEKDCQYHLSASEPQDAFWSINEPHSSNVPFNHFPNQEDALNLSFMQGPQNLNSTCLLQDNLVNAAINGQNGERLPSRSNSGAIEEQSFLSTTRDSHPSDLDARYIGKSIFSKDLAEVKRKGTLCASKAMKGMGRPVSPVEEKIAELPKGEMDFGIIPIKANSRHDCVSSPGGNQSLYSHEMGHDISSGEEVSNDSVPSILTKGLNKASHERPPQSPALSSHDGLAGLASASVVKQKSSMNLPSNEKRHESGGNLAATLTGNSQASEKKEMRLRRTSSYRDATVPETSFIDVLKKPVYSEADVTRLAALESFDGGSQTARSSKKKGKKGRQIDPALLGFKVSSNRIMMGEIHRPED